MLDIPNIRISIKSKIETTSSAAKDMNGKCDWKRERYVIDHCCPLPKT